MSKICIFEKERDRLFAACFDDSEVIQAYEQQAGQSPVKDELDKALDFWSNAKLVRDFFITIAETSQHLNLP